MRVVTVKTCDGLKTYLLGDGGLLRPEELDGVSLEGMAAHWEGSRTSLIKLAERLGLRLDFPVLTLRL